MFKKFLSILFILFLFTSPAQAFFDNNGVRLSYGTSNYSFVGPCPKDTDSYSWFSGSYFLEKEIYNWLDFETTVGVGYLDSEMDSTPSVEWRGLLNLHKNKFYLKFGGGFAYLFNSSNMPDLADSWVYGIITTEIGISVIQKNKFTFNVGYVINHISSPFHEGKDGDFGWNVGGISMQIKYKF